ncbi:MAG: NUDIX domain-containing protein [Microscillaceae bacterium]|nr:NUDIX domain-containing protein [Microscillaceae bacterium]MDW8461776.1 NUDIX domain-containing protein [Cytophagales bacterium]
MLTFQKDSFCSYCGASFGEISTYPKNCSNCQNITYRNPIPVAVALLPTENQGIITIQRNVEPQKGKLAFPGGYIDFGETWQQALVREVHEETQMQLSPELFQVFDVHSPPQNASVVLIFGIYQQKLREMDWANFQPTTETSRLVVLQEFQELAFPLHSYVLKRFFEGSAYSKTL